MPDYKFKSKDFYDLLVKQKYLCPITGRELTPETTCAEHRIPLRMGGKHALENIYLVNEMASRLKRQFTEHEILEFALDVVRTLGEQNESIPGVAVKRKSTKSK